MLQSSEYHTCALSIANGLERVPHCSDWVFDDPGISELLVSSQRLWAEKCEADFGSFGEGWEKVLKSPPLKAVGMEVQKKRIIPVSGVEAKDVRVQLSG